ncbi:hypothetical protein A2Z23_01615 [Candidatus Curtissbacteria bacterium RBG_16_39_7]|uniref:Glycosyltransferase 2-like domain-containing protein n=1 Tax=Candidatus Curtissbacteria bacterium RBG_16_39_7 TaxID=1797707 RepID=A0A1F5G4Y1_9BACT|nr:MAG: hypothetical protein A2Z23_01615 [Candidatus Curtissbacteria bacterium RBG_16_39_7]
MATTNISIIIVNHNTKELLKNCLSSIAKSKDNLAKEILVVDNASTDGSVQAIKNFPGIQLIQNITNMGFSKACNQAIKKAKGKYILLLNPDTVLERDTLAEMVSFMDKNPKIGVATCRVELPNVEIDWASHRGFPTPWRSFTYFSRLSKLFPGSRIFGGYHFEHEDLQKPHEIDSPCGAFYLVKSEAIKKIGLLDEDYFIFAEDLDWSYRIKNAGYKIFYYPKVKIIHHKGAASGMHKVESRAEKKERKKAVESFYDTMKIFYEKHYQAKYPKWVKSLAFWGIDFLKKRRIAKLGFD